MGISKRVLSAALAASMLVTVCLPVASCKKKTGSASTVSATDPWYTAKRIELDPQFDPDLYYLVFPAGPFLCQDKYVMVYDAMQRNYDDGEYSAKEVYLMGIFDQDGNLLNMIDLYEIMKQSPSVYNVFMVHGCCESEKGIRFYYIDAGFLSSYYCDIDPDTGLQAGAPQLIDLSGVLDPKSDSDFFLSYLSLIEDYEVLALSNQSSTRSKIVVSKDAQVLHCIDMEKVFGPGEGAFVNGISGIGGGKIIFDCYGKSHLWGELDLATGEVTKIPDGRPVPANQTFSTTRDGKGYLTNATGIYEFNPANGQGDLKLNFDSCDVNRYESQYGSVLSINENAVIFGCCSRILEFYSLPLPAVVYRLEKADSNPNAGKSIVTVASLSNSLTHSEAEALMVFNEQNQDYFAQLVLYDQGQYSSDEEVDYDIDNTDFQRYSAMALVSGSLISDIRSGMGPDVILGASQSVDLLDSAYLADLTPYLKSKSFDSSKYYSKLIDAAQMDGKTYFIPTAFTVAGIVTDGTKLDAGQKGFTYEQYSSFVKGDLNGAEPVTREVTRMHFLNMCIQSSYTGWLQNNKMDFDQEEFRELAGFFKDNIPEGKTELSDKDKIWTVEAYSITENKDAVFIEDINGLQILSQNNYFGKNLKVLGLPSKDASGPTAKVTNSFSIAEGSPVEDGAYAFLDILLSEDVQAKCRETIPVNRASVLRKIDRETEQNQIGYNRASSVPRDAMLNSFEEELRESALFDPATGLPDIFLEMLEGVDSIMIPDNSVLMIVSEEMPPYFVEQKNIDDVIAVINSRTQVVFDER